MKTIKMLLYGEPGVGKSVFASKAPKPFFITTDGNYEWLEDFGAIPEAHQQVYSWDEAKNLFAQPFDNYDTIVVDLIEDLFKWCEQEYCIKSRIDHVSDVGFGKGYDITRNEFFLEISKLLSKPKNIILISHGITFTTKDRRGVEHTKYAPSSRIPDKVWDMIEGRLRYCLRCYLKAEETSEGELTKKRYLSLVPKENEFGIIRGINENTIPHDIPLDWNDFVKAIKFDNNVAITSDAEEHKTVGITVTEANPLPFDDTPTDFETAQRITDDVEDKQSVETASQTVEQVKSVATEIQQTVQEIVKTETKPQTNADKIAAIKAKLEALKKSNQ